MSKDHGESVIEPLEEMTESTAAMACESSAETALVVSCSMSTCEDTKTLWPIGPSWNVINVPTLGNQTWERYDGETILDGTLAHLTTEHDVTAVIVVGHTTCEVVADAYEQCVAPTPESPAGIEAQLRPLVSIIDETFEADVLDESAPLRTARYRLVEYNVIRQVAFLRKTLPDSITTIGYVHDQDGVYNVFPGKRYVVTLDGETAFTEIQTRLPDDASAQVASVLNASARSDYLERRERS